MLAPRLVIRGVCFRMGNIAFASKSLANGFVFRNPRLYSPNLSMRSYTTEPEATHITDDSFTSVSAPEAPASEKLVTSEDEVEIKDPIIIFRNVWQKLEKKHGRENLHFPKEIIWLMGAPGAGKTTHTPYINRTRGITASPIVMSELLTSPEATRLKQEGRLVGDSMVIEILLDKLLHPIYQAGVVVDGFPRTQVQVECTRLLHEKMKELRRDFAYFHRPAFRVCVLFIDQNESIQRQRSRGVKNMLHNLKVMQMGDGKLVEERATDADEEKLLRRYAVFKQHYGTLEKLREHFTFSLIDASGPIREVERKIIKEFQYQSSLELSEETYDVIQAVPLMEEMIKHTRQELVKRLDKYQTEDPDTFNTIASIIKKEFLPLVLRHAMSGQTLVRPKHPLFQEKEEAIDMVLDILTERGYHAISDIKEERIPVSIDPKTMEINCRLQRNIEFKISFKKTDLRTAWLDIRNSEEDKTESS
eukprot:TRINITY_DN7481_c0_g1_i1.p1 TRINITY_DN7481_c0_g1~~TRINITY_DN7481_c0_g1_i1.p1  ORF type:complete len:475 (-),score=90.51 TRINITY_DN7481_c0_g1_i1:102-1526(-)